jgi:glycosyltransferase involved in cell wall biosynthesis
LLAIQNTLGLAMSTPFVSVIIPVYNDPGRLKTCLSALEAQTYPKSSFEVVVVDNGSEEGLESITSAFGHARLTHESRPGSYAARNQGLSLAKGEILAFTDADCIPSRDWIERGVQNLLPRPNRGIIAGRIDIFFRYHHRPTAIELYQLMPAFSQKRLVEQLGFGQTANLFTMRLVFEHVGPFDDGVKSLGDFDWCRRATSCGFELIYADDTRVLHPARHSFAELYEKVRRTIGGAHDLRGKKKCSLPGIDRGLMTGMVPPLRFTLDAVHEERLRRPADKLKVIAVMFCVRYAEAWERIRLRLGGRSRR